MTILFCGLINILSFYFTGKLLTKALQNQNDLKDRLTLLENEILDIRKKLRVINA